MDCDLIGARDTSAEGKARGQRKLWTERGLEGLPGGRAWGSNSLGLAHGQAHTGRGSRPPWHQGKQLRGGAGRPAGDRWRRAVCHKDTFLLAALRNFCELKTFP